MADRSALRDNVKYRLGNRTDPTNARLDNWLNDGLLDLATQRIEIPELQTIGNNVTSQIGVFFYTRQSGMFALLYLEDTTNSDTLKRIPGGFNEFLTSKQGLANSTPRQFTEWGNSFAVLPAPDVATISWTPYYYARPTWAAGDAAVPDIPEEWHYGIELVSTIHAQYGIGDDDGAERTQREFEAWLNRRDTRVKRSTRFTRPQRGVQPSVIHRNSRTGV
jgi:hypothetical protein